MSPATKETKWQRSSSSQDDGEAPLSDYTFFWLRDGETERYFKNFYSIFSLT